jgi:predicted nucleic acid-binding protein
LLRSQFGEVRIPSAVHAELQRLRHATALRAIQDAIDAGWIRPCAVLQGKLVQSLAAMLDAGEAEAIALALELRAELILLDEKDGRRAAERAGLRVTGVLGILLRAKQQGAITQLKPEIEALRALARFYVSPGLRLRVLEAAGE